MNDDARPTKFIFVPPDVKREARSWNDDPRAITWAFVCQKGKLEAQACLLTASLWDQSVRRGVTVAIPSPDSCGTEVSPKVMAFLSRFNVRIEVFDNLYLAGRTQRSVVDFVTNKIFCLKAAGAGDLTVFLDSDHLCLRPIDTASEFAMPITARPVGGPGALAVATFWEDAYRICQHKMPSCRFRTATPDGGQVFSPPCFNSGLIAIQSDRASDFADLWFDCFRRLRSTGLLGKSGYFTDQVALAIAVDKSGIPYHVANPEPIDAGLHHYISVPLLRSRPDLITRVRQLVDRHDGLRPILSKDPEWFGVTEIISCDADRATGTE